MYKITFPDSRKFTGEYLSVSFLNGTGETDKAYLAKRFRAKGLIVSEMPVESEKPIEDKAPVEPEMPVEEAAIEPEIAAEEEAPIEPEATIEPEAPAAPKSRKKKSTDNE